MKKILFILLLIFNATHCFAVNIINLECISTNGSGHVNSYTVDESNKTIFNSYNRKTYVAKISGQEIVWSDTDDEFCGLSVNSINRYSGILTATCPNRGVHSIPSRCEIKPNRKF